jgi:hypothetical protein
MRLKCERNYFLQSACGATHSVLWLVQTNETNVNFCHVINKVVIIIMQEVDRHTGCIISRVSNEAEFSKVDVHTEMAAIAPCRWVNVSLLELIQGTFRSTL